MDVGSAGSIREGIGMNYAPWKHTTLFALLILVISGAISGCGPGPRVFVLHSPIQPTSAQPVTYTASAEDPDGVASIEIWEDRHALRTCHNGTPCATRISTTRLTLCEFKTPRPSERCSVTIEKGYPDGSLIGYLMIARDVRGNWSREGWIYYAAGAFPWPDLPVPVYVTGNPKRSLDLVFIPDESYSGDTRRFMEDVTELIHQAYLSPLPFAEDIRNWRGFWNFYITYHPGSTKGYGRGCSQPPPNWTALRAVVNGGAILHRTADLRDCNAPGEGALFSIGLGQARSYPVALHATAHALFGLADQYCCNGAYWELEPESNIFSSRANCRAHAAAHGWPVTDCVEISPPSWWRTSGTSGWWRSDRAGGLMEDMTRTDTGYGRAGRQRVQWVYLHQCAGAAGC